MGNGSKIVVTNVAAFGTSGAGGGIVNSGVISATGNAISVSEVGDFEGGIVNTSAGSLTASGFAVSVGSVSTFGGGVVNSGSIDAAETGIVVGVTTSFSGGVANSGTISAGPAGIIAEDMSDFTGGIRNSGKITAGIAIDANSITTFEGGIASSGTLAGTGLRATDMLTFDGGMNNSGVISGGKTGVDVQGISQFSGGMTNSGAVTASTSGMYAFELGTFAGGMTNTGTIVATQVTALFAIDLTEFSGGIINTGSLTGGFGGITVNHVTQFAGGISSGGDITAGVGGIQVFDVRTFDGGISESGAISSSSRGIFVSQVGEFDVSGADGALVNTGVLSAGGNGIAVANVDEFAGGLLNGATGRITAGAFGISVGSVSIFTGGVTNNGSITSVSTGVAVGVTTSFSGGVTNSGTISGGAAGIIAEDMSDFTGGIRNSGKITAGIAIDANRITTFEGGIASSGTLTGTGLRATDMLTFDGGMNNSGVISGGKTGLDVQGISQFSGGMTNSGAVTASTSGMYAFELGTFAGGMTNTGTIVATQVTALFAIDLTEFSGGIINTGSLTGGSGGITVNHVTQFAGGISSSGDITAGVGGIQVFDVRTFDGGISESGEISSSSRGIFVSQVGEFDSSAADGGLVNSGVISAADNGIAIDNVSDFGGGVVNAAGASITASSNGVAIESASTFAGGVVNNGAITATEGTGLSIVNVASFAEGVTNSGTLTGSSRGLFVDGVSEFSGAIHNSGRISGEVGIQLLAAPASTVDIDNSGTISGSSNGVLVSTGAATITNAAGALISASTGSGIGVVLYGGGSITNAGAISGPGGSVTFGGGEANTLTLQSGSTLTGAAVGNGASGAANALILQGTGVADNRFANFTTLDAQAGANWTLGADESFGSASVEGSLTIDARVAAPFAIDGGGLNFDVASGDAVSFNGSGVLEVDAAFSGAIAGFGAGDAIDYKGAATGADWSGDVLTVEDGTTAVASLNLVGDFAGQAFAVAQLSPSVAEITEVPCFAAGTRILTDHGEVEVERLSVGDLLVTASGALRPVVWIERREIDLDRHPEPESVRPVRLAAGALGETLPHRDLVVSPEHALWIDNLWAPAGALLNGATIRQEAWSRVVYFHVELPGHDILLAEGAPAESYLDCDNRRGFDNAPGGVTKLHPDRRAALDSRRPAPLAATARLREALARRACESGRGAEVHVYQMRQRAPRTNHVRNPRGEGAAPGRFGAEGRAPFGWWFDAPEGVAIEIRGQGETEGLPFLDLRFTGRASKAGVCRIYPEIDKTIVVRPVELWTVSLWLALAGGSLDGVEDLALYLDEYGADGDYLAGGAYRQPPPTADRLALQRLTATRKLSRRDVSAMTGYLRIGLIAGEPIDLTVRLAGPQIEAGAWASDLILPPRGEPGVSERATRATMVTTRARRSP